MADEYRGLAAFVAVHQAGSFSAAGRRLKLSTSVVSHHVSRLEERLGVPLFFRSTRSLSLTGEGARILPAAQRMVAAGEEALDALSEDGAQPVGALRIALPAFGTGGGVHAAIWRFAKAHPLVSVSVHSSDVPVDLIAEGYDIAIRIGRLPDSSLKTRRIGTFHRKVVAAPDYLRGRPALTEPQDLRALDFISLSMLPRALAFVRDGEEVTLPLENIRLEVDAVTAGRAAVLAGLGVMSLPLNEIAEDLRRGAVVEVLPEWGMPTYGVYAVWPDSGPQKRLTRRLIDALAQGALGAEAPRASPYSPSSASTENTRS